MLRHETNKDMSQIVVGGCTAVQKPMIVEVVGYQEGACPFRYLGVPITSNTLNKLECRQLLEKMTKKVKVWATKQHHTQVE